MKYSKESLEYYYVRFSKSTKILLAKARLIAVELGFDYICETHFIIADCRLNNSKSIKGFIFLNDEALADFIKKNKKENQTIFPEYDSRSLPLTRNTEQMIRNSLLEAEKLGDNEIEPYHMFLGSCNIENFMFVSPVKSQEDLYQQLLEYYKKKEVLISGKTGGRLNVILRKIFKRNN